MNFLIDNYLLKKEVFIIAGGESIDSINPTLLEGKLLITINKSFLNFPNAIINYSQDSNFYSNIVQKIYGQEFFDLWFNFSGIKVFAKLDNFDFPKGEIQTINIKKIPSISKTLNEGIYVGSNSGLGALMLAITLGATKINLLGYDLVAKDKTHWHSGYGEEINLFNSKLEVYKKDIESIAPMLLSNGIEIINRNKLSKLTCFPKVEF